MRTTRAGIAMLETAVETEDAKRTADAAVSGVRPVTGSTAVPDDAAVGAAGNGKKKTRAALPATTDVVLAAVVNAKKAPRPKIATFESGAMSQSVAVPIKPKRNARAKITKLETAGSGAVAVKPRRAARAKRASLETVAATAQPTSGTESATIAEVPTIAISLVAAENGAVAVPRKRKGTTPAKVSKLETAAPSEPPEVTAGSIADELKPAEVPAIAVATKSADDATVVVARKRETTDLADLIDSLRGRAAPAENAKPEDELPLAAVELFERCARDYQRESDKLVHRRHRIGTLVYPASEDQADVIGAFFVRSLGLRIVDLDTEGLNRLSDEDAAVWLATLKEPTAHIVALHGLGSDSDPRVFAAIESADVDVLVLGFAAPGATFSPSVQRCLKYRIDLQQKLALQVDLGCFDDASPSERRNGRPDGGAPSDLVDSAPGKGHGLFERILRFFRADARAAGS
jgi:hypothetical protein